MRKLSCIFHPRFSNVIGVVVPSGLCEESLILLAVLDFGPGENGSLLPSGPVPEAGASRHHNTLHLACVGGVI